MEKLGKPLHIKIHKEDNAVNSNANSNNGTPLTLEPIIPTAEPQVSPKTSDSQQPDPDFQQQTPPSQQPQTQDSRNKKGSKNIYGASTSGLLVTFDRDLLNFDALLNALSDVYVSEFKVADAIETINLKVTEYVKFRSYLKCTDHTASISLLPISVELHGGNSAIVAGFITKGGSIPVPVISSGAKKFQDDTSLAQCSLISMQLILGAGIGQVLTYQNKICQVKLKTLETAYPELQPIDGKVIIPQCVLAMMDETTDIPRFDT